MEDTTEINGIEELLNYKNKDDFDRNGECMRSFLCRADKNQLDIIEAKLDYLIKKLINQS